MTTPQSIDDRRQGLKVKREAPPLVRRIVVTPDQIFEEKGPDRHPRRSLESLVIRYVMVSAIIVGSLTILMAVGLLLLRGR